MKPFNLELQLKSLVEFVNKYTFWNLRITIQHRVRFFCYLLFKDGNSGVTCKKIFEIHESPSCYKLLEEVQNLDPTLAIPEKYKHTVVPLEISSYIAMLCEGK